MTIVVISRQRVNHSTTFVAFICTAWNLSNIWELKADIVCRYNTGVIYKTLNLTEIHIFNFVQHFRRIVYQCECVSSLVPALLSSRAVLSVMYMSSIWEVFGSNRDCLIGRIVNLYQDISLAEIFYNKTLISSFLGNLGRGLSWERQSGFI